jgi:parvulin-like peptidyl-prolyl isomerase
MQARVIASWMLTLAVALSPALARADADDATLAGAAAPLPGKHTQVVAERVVAIVNDAIILDTELDARMLPLMAEIEQIQDLRERARRKEKLRSQVLDEMISEELIVQAAEQAKVEVDSSEVQAALDEIKTQNKLDDAGLQQLLAAQGFTMSNYRADLRRQLLRLRAVNMLVAPKVTVTDEDVHARYDEMARRSQAVSSVRVARILIALPDHPTEQQLADAKERAAKAMDRIKAGEDFAKVVADVSDDTSTKTTGGELGWFERGSLQKGWEDVVFSMEKDDVRGPIASSEGLNIFKAIDVKSSGLKPFAQMKEQLKAELRRREMDKQTQVWLDDLRKKAYIDNKL